MIEIPLTQGKTAFIDDIDEDNNRVKWQVTRRGSNGNIRYYVIRHICKSDGKGTMQYLHRVIMERILGRKLEKGEEVYHIDHNGLNNQRNNLRLATPGENRHNQRLHQYSKSSKYKGIYWDKHNEKWIAQIQVNGRRKTLGRFKSEEDARDAYDLAAIRYFGKFAWTNAMMEITATEVTA